MKRLKEQFAPAVFVFAALITTLAAPAHAAAPIKLNDTLVAGGDVSSSGLQFSPDSNRVLYRADQDTDEVLEIYSVPSGGGTPVKLNGTLVTGGDVYFILQFSPDSSRVLYQADQDIPNVAEIYSVPSGGGTPVKLNDTLVAGGRVFASGLQFSPDSSRVLYYADQDTDEVAEIYIVPSGGGTPVKLNNTMVAGGNVDSIGLQFSPDGSRVLYLADQDTDGVNEAYVRIVRDRANTGGGDWDSSASWDQNVAPDEVMQVFIDTPSTVTATGNTTTRTVNELVLGGGAGTSTLDLEAGAIITAMHGFAIRSGGVLRGDGRIVGDVSIVAGGEIRVGDSEQLQIGGASFANSGRIEVIGTSFSPAEIEFDGAVTNDATTGMIAAENATLRFNGGLTNDGAVAVSFGTSRVFGDVINSVTGNIAIAGNSNVTFYDDVANSGTLNVFTGSTVVFFGALTGNGNIGGGDVQALGDLLPGASPGTMVFGGDLIMGGTTTLGIEIEGTTQGSEYDTLDITGDALLSGTLDILFLNDFTPSAGNVFEIISAGSITGLFDTVNLPSLTGDLEWFLNYSATSVELVSTFSADFEEDGDVDSFDLARWEANYGSTTAVHMQGDANADTTANGLDFLAWQRQFTGSLNSLSSAAAVPEPTSLVLVAACCVSCLFWGAVRRRPVL